MFANRKKAFWKIAEICFYIAIVAAYYFITASRERPYWGGFWIQIIFIALSVYIAFVKQEGRNSLDTVVIGPDGVRKRSWFRTITIHWDEVERIDIMEVGEPYSGLVDTKYKIRKCIIVSGTDNKKNTYEEIHIDNRDDVIDCIGRFYDLPHDFRENVVVGEFKG